MNIYTYEVKAHNAPINTDPVTSNGQGVIGVDTQISANETKLIEDSPMEKIEDKREVEFARDNNYQENIASITL